MKHILKESEPPEFTNWKKKDKMFQRGKPKWNRIPSSIKDNIRASLKEEQGYICCYCMSRVEFPNSKIEHFKPRSLFRGQQLEYSNLFVACLGGEGGGKNKQHCDTKKGNDALNYIDLFSSVENDIEYHKDGLIFSTNINIDDEINSVLNLNYDILKENRKEALEQLMIDLKKLGFSIPNLQRTLKKYKHKNAKGKYRPFCEMVVYFLNKKLKSKGAI